MSLLQSLMAKQAGVKDEPKTAAPKTEPDSSQRSVPPKDLVVPESKDSKTNSLLGALRTQSGTKGDDSAKPADDNERADSSSGSKEAAPRQPLLNGTAQTGGIVASKPTGLLSGIAASRERAEKAKQDHSYLYDEIPKDFGETLKRFDQLMQRDQGDIDIDLPHMRNYVSRIMVDLKTNPEYNDLVHDGDVHNIIKFIRRTQSEARAIINQKIDKRARSESKPKAKNRFAMDLSSLDLGASPSDKPKSIQDLSDIDF